MEYVKKIAELIMCMLAVDLFKIAISGRLNLAENIFILIGATAIIVRLVFSDSNAD